MTAVWNRKLSILTRIAFALAVFARLDVGTAFMNQSVNRNGRVALPSSVVRKIHSVRTMAPKDLVADGEKTSSEPTHVIYDEDTNKDPTFPLSLVGLKLPPLPFIALPLGLAYFRSIPFWDMFFSIAYPTYLGLVNRFRFDNNANLYNLRKKQGRKLTKKPEWFVQNQEKWFKKYLIVASTVTVLVPLLVQFFAPAAIAQATAPHLFILLCQIAMERMSYNPKCHPIISLMTPIGFNAYRMSALKTWATTAFAMMTATGNTGVFTWATAHVVIALANVVFWTYNLFFLLTMRVLPPNFDQEKFLDSNHTWERYYQLIPSINPATSTTASDSSTNTE